MGLCRVKEIKLRVGNYLSISSVAQALDVSNVTVGRWYTWWEDDNYKKPDDLYLPKYTYLDKRKIKFFHQDDLEALRIFKEKINTTHRGAMAEFNTRFIKGE